METNGKEKEFKMDAVAKKHLINMLSSKFDDIVVKTRNDGSVDIKRTNRNVIIESKDIGFWINYDGDQYIIDHIHNWQDNNKYDDKILEFFEEEENIATDEFEEDWLYIDEEITKKSFSASFDI